MLFVRIRRPWSLRDYLALRGVPAKTILAWLGIVLLLGIGFEAVTWLVGRTAVTDFMITVYSTAGFVPLLWLTLAVEAPLFEEVFFRGFMFRGIQQSRFGSIGAIAITALTWTIIHV